MNPLFAHPMAGYLERFPELQRSQAVGGGLFGAAERYESPLFARHDEQVSAARDRWRELVFARDRATMAENQALGPREHGAYSEFRTLEKPIYGAIEQLLAIPAYTGAKTLGFLTDERTTPPSLDEMAEGYRGVGRGLGRMLGLYP